MFFFIYNIRVRTCIENPAYRKQLNLLMYAESRTDTKKTDSHTTATATAHPQIIVHYNMEEADQLNIFPTLTIQMKYL